MLILILIPGTAVLCGGDSVTDGDLSTLVIVSGWVGWVPKVASVCVFPEFGCGCVCRGLWGVGWGGVGLGSRFLACGRWL